MNRRGFIGSILGAVAWSESKFGVPLYPVIGNDGKLHGYSPAASAIQPTCSMDEAAQRDGSCVIDRVNISSCDSAWVNNCNSFQIGQLVDIYAYDFVFRGTAMVASIYEAKDILHLSWDSNPQAGDYLVVHGGSAPGPNPIPRYRVGGAYMGLSRSV